MTTEAKAASTLTRREAVAILSEYELLGHAITETQKRRTGLGDAIKRWFATTGEAELVDGENGLVARLQRRRGPAAYDVASMPAELVLALQPLGALNVDAKVLRALKGKMIEADDAERFAIPGAETVALIVAREDSARAD
mgnify:CR=1 FL=1